MKKKNIIILIVVLNIFMIGSLVVITKATMENKLRNEVDSLSRLDVTKDNYNTSIKTIGGYAIVEKAIKEYLNEYAQTLQKMITIKNDPKLTKLLSYNNYTTDAPTFTTSINYINTNKKEFNSYASTLDKKLDEREIKKFIRTRTKNKYYIKLYDDLMLNNEISSKFKNTKEAISKSKTYVNNSLDTSLEVLNFLSLYKDSWVCEDGQIKFQTQELYNYYNSLISKVSAK